MIVDKDLINKERLEEYRQLVLNENNKENLYHHLRTLYSNTDWKFEDLDDEYVFDTICAELSIKYLRLCLDEEATGIFNHFVDVIEPYVF